MIEWLYWVISLTIVTYTSVYIVKKYPSYGYAALLAFYTIYIGIAQVLAARVIVFDLGIITFLAPGSVFIYPFIAQVTDMINEAYGRRMTHVAIGIVFVTQLILVVFILMVNSLAPAPYFAVEEAWQSIFSLSIRITMASWVAFLITSNMDAIIFAGLKKRYLQKEVQFTRTTLLNPYVWLRSSVSDVANLTLDSVIFVSLAFYGVAPVVPLIIGQIVSKNIVGFIDNPWFVWYKSMLKNKGEIIVESLSKEPAAT